MNGLVLSALGPLRKEASAKKIEVSTRVTEYSGFSEL